MNRILLFVALALAVLTPPASAAPLQTEYTRTELLAHAPQGLAPGQPLWLGLSIRHAPHWHTYWSPNRRFRASPVSVVGRATELDPAGGRAGRRHPMAGAAQKLPSAAELVPGSASCCCQVVGLPPPCPAATSW